MTKTPGVAVNRKSHPYLPCILFLLLIPILNNSIASGQTYYFDTYGASEGASSKIYCLLQDHNHYIWLGTPGGIARFDGSSFENFTSETGLARRAVRTIFQDSKENIWFGHYGGGISLYHDNEFKQFSELDTMIRGDITSIFEDNTGQIWITTAASGAFLISDVLDSKSINCTQFLGKHNLSDRVFNYCLTDDNTIYLITDVGIRKFNDTENSFEVFHPGGLTTYFSIITMFEDKQKNLWFGTHKGGLYKYMPTKDSILIYDIRDGLSSNFISTLLQDRNGSIWVGTWGGGITRINENEIKVYNTDNGLSAEYIFSIIEDVEGNILIGSSHKGFSIFKGDLFENYKDGLTNHEVYAIQQDNSKNFWIGTNNGITIFDSLLNNVVVHYQKENLFAKQMGIKISSKIRFIKQDQNHNMWIGTEDQRVQFYDWHQKKFEEATEVNKWFASSDYQVSAMDIDKRNNLWIGTRDGLVKYNIQKKSLQRFSTANGLSGNDISTIYCDEKNRIWVGTNSEDKINMISGQTIESYLFGTIVTPSCFAEDQNGILWIGTKAQGIYIFENDTLIRKLDIGNGLLSNLINTLNIDRHNRIYIGTNKGLNVYNRKNEKIHTYSQKNGFIGIETNPSASYADDRGNLWFGTNSGFNKMNTTVISTKLTEPLINITTMRINQVERKMVQNMRLKYFENHISFNYKSICLTNSDAVRYRIMLEGVDNDWQEVTRQSEVTYQALAPGSYRFMVIARNSDGIWNEEPAVLDFQIMTPFYIRWYFILTAIILILLFFSLYIKIREKNLVKEKNILEGKVKERTLELEQVNTELAYKNKNITDSIRYARRIQQAILPPEIPFDDMFVLFKPKDIVSGDFYWLTIMDDTEIIAAIDCTGHGVPGAFMSFIGYSSLNEVVKEKRILKPSDILDHLNNEVVTALNLKGDEALKDGMDLALISYNQKSFTLQYAGAYNPLYLLRNGDLTEIRADRFPIGRSEDMEKKFTNHSMKIEKGDTIYMFSDGYADQFGGPDDKKFKTGALKRLLIEIHNKSMSDQKNILENTIEEWRGTNEQVDDILLIGRKF